MIKLQLNRYKIVSLLKIVNLIIEDLGIYRSQLKFSMKVAEITAHISELEILGRKLQIKCIMTSHKPEMCNFFFSISKMQAYIIMLYKDNRLPAASNYDIGTMQELSVPIFKKLLN